MPDREKVIKGLEYCMGGCQVSCFKCPYRDIGEIPPDCLDNCRILQDAVELLKESVSGWISVKDRLPDVKNGVLWYSVKEDGYGEIRISSWSGTTNHGIPHVWEFGDSFTPLYWMPLPQAPDADEAYLESKNKPKEPVMAGSKVYSGIWLCPRCRSELTKITGTKTVFAGIPNYCPYCGQRLKLPNETVQVPEPK